MLPDQKSVWLAIVKNQEKVQRPASKRCDQGRSGAMFRPGGAQISYDDGKWSGSVSPSAALIRGNGSQRPRAGMLAHAVNPAKAVCV